MAWLGGERGPGGEEREKGRGAEAWVEMLYSVDHLFLRFKSLRLRLLNYVLGNLGCSGTTSSDI